MRIPRLTISLFLLILVAALCPSGSLAAPQPKLDTSVVEVRMMGKDRVEAYKAQRDFNYKVQQPEQMDFWDKVMWWIGKKIDELFSNKVVNKGFNWLIWVLSFAILAYAIVRIIGTDKVMLFVKGRRQAPLAFTAGEEDIHGRDIDAEIAAAESQAEFRRAVRLQYLRSLRLLSDNGRISWTTSKTNIDYLSELRGSALENGFRRITRIFEYAWYGEMEISRDQYDMASSWFTDFNSTTRT